MPSAYLFAMLSDTFAGIAPSRVIAFIAAQLAGMATAVSIGKWLWVSNGDHPTLP